MNGNRLHDRVSIVIYLNFTVTFDSKTATTLKHFTKMVTILKRAFALLCLLPSHAFSTFDCLSECHNNPCSCEELTNCLNCHSIGCGECDGGYFKKDNNYPCSQCQDTFGSECLHCADFHGCQQCKTGYQR